MKVHYYSFTLKELEVSLKELLFPLKTKKAVHIAQALKSTFEVYEHPIAKYPYSDNAKEFVNEICVY